MQFVKLCLVLLGLMSTMMAQNSTKSFPDYLRGSIVPMVTTYQGEDATKLDLDAMARFTDYLCSTEISALFPVSGMGQWKDLSVAEKKQIITTCVNAAKKRKPVIAGVGSANNVEEVIEVAKFAESAGVDAIVIVTPSFIREQQPLEGKHQYIQDQNLLLSFYRATCKSVKCHIFLYDPMAELEAATVATLVDEFPHIIGMKYRETKDMQRFAAMVQAVKGKIGILSGSEYVTVETMKAGAVGVVGGGMNIYPHLSEKLVDLCAAGKWQEAEILQKQVSHACDMMGKLSGKQSGAKVILKEVIGVEMDLYNRNSRPRKNPVPEEEKQQALQYFLDLNLPKYKK